MIRVMKRSEAKGVKKCEKDTLHGIVAKFQGKANRETCRFKHTLTTMMHTLTYLDTPLANQTTPSAATNRRAGYMYVAMTSITSTLEETPSRLASDVIVSFSSPDTLRLRLWSLSQRNEL
jgi:hypothetical protein